MNELSRRRLMMAGAASLPLAAILADPKLRAEAANGLEQLTTTLPNGRVVHAALATPASVPAGAVLLVHEWWGLNGHIQAMAAEFAREGFVALAVDLYGEVAQTPDQAEALMAGVDPLVASDTLVSWIEWLYRDRRVNGRVATLGWCFGGGWALHAAIMSPVNATVIYYGRVERTLEDLKRLGGPVLGHFAERDAWINHSTVDPFVARMKEAKQPVEVFWYDADHAFANPTGDNYDSEDAQLAWRRTLDFLRANLRG
ncbi:MAG: dienelactone hydrolase family protein [Rhodospirillaceae bacterium]|nr:dienelactone hydrolase family protein [Rhodospirillaceae bacterium]